MTSNCWETDRNNSKEEQPCYVSRHLSGRDEIHHQSHLSEAVACGKGGSRDSSEGVLWDPRNFSKNEKQHCFPSNFTLIDRRFYEAMVVSSCIKKEIRYIALADDFPNSQPLFLGAQQSDFCSVLCLWVGTAKRRPMAYLYGPKMGWPSSTACVGLLVNPKIRPNLQTILHQWSGVLSRYQS